MKTRGWMVAVLILAGVSAGAFYGIYLGIGSRWTCPARTEAQWRIWANDGGEKIPQEELRASCASGPVNNRVWDGGRIRLFGARNEVLSFNLIIEASRRDLKQVSVEFHELAGPGGERIATDQGAGDPTEKLAAFDWRKRNIETFLVQYLEIRGLSAVSYDTYDERHIPEKFRRPIHSSLGNLGGWKARPHAGLSYPDIAVPMEWKPRFDVLTNESQSVWVDIYVPKTASAGIFEGVLTVREGADRLSEIPVQLEVRDFTLPDRPAARTMLFVSYEDILSRYGGNRGAAEEILDRHFQLAHRHRISLIDDNLGADESGFEDRPRDRWIPRLSGELFTPGRGYAGPGEGIGNDVFSIGTYGKWRAVNDSRDRLWRYTDAWESWFRKNFPEVERFLYLIDESPDLAQIQTWAKWMDENPGPGKALASFATVPLFEPSIHLRAGTKADSMVDLIPNLDIFASTFSHRGSRAHWEGAVASLRKADQGKKRFYLYNARRPGTGSFATEDDGVALRQLPWAQHKMGVDRWFFWQGTYYTDWARGKELKPGSWYYPRHNLFEQAMTFGENSRLDRVIGNTGSLYSNGDGVLFYPGTDTLYPHSSYGVPAPIASLRLKHWRRGIQDVEYLVLAQLKSPERTRAILEKMIPKALWEYDVTDPNDPTWVKTDLSWSNDPEVWEAARAELADIIEGK